MHRGQQLFVDAAYPYGPVSITLFAAIAKVAGNTPLTYLGVLAILAAASAGLAAHLMSRVAATSLALGLAVAALLPTMPLPGAPIGGYISSIYFPVERIVLLAALLLWKVPADRSGWRSVAIGGVLGVSQGVRFGPGVVMLAPATPLRRVRRGAATDGAPPSPSSPDSPPPSADGSSGPR